jgi:hypothetical protein
MSGAATSVGGGVRPRNIADGGLAVPRSWARRQAWWVWPLVLYLTLSVLLFGLPVIGHLGSRIIAANEIDPSADMWFLGWWPHAVLHGTNPFVTHAMFYPDGYNLQWATSMPLLSLLSAPLTLAFGPAVSWNVIMLLSPAVSAWTAYLLCRALRAGMAPSLVGGFLFGFSPYLVTNLTGNPMLAMVALVPVFVLLVVRRQRGEMTDRRFVVCLGLALAAQYLIYAEILLTSTIFGVVALLSAAAMVREWRASIAQLVRLLLAAYAVAAVLVSPFLLEFVFGPHYPPSATTNFASDLTWFVRPPGMLGLLLHRAGTVPGGNSESYLGVPLIVIVALALWQLRGRREIRLLGVCLLAAVIASLGIRLDVGGHSTGIPLPWDLIRRVPVLRYAIPVRLALFVMLFAALLAALWLGARRGPAVARWGLAVLAIAFIAPEVGNRNWHVAIADPAFFRENTYRAYLHASDHVLTIPAWGPNERWVADAGFPFALVGGYAGQHFPSGYTRFPTWNTLLTGRLTPDYAAQLRRFLAAKRVTAIVVQAGYPGPWQRLFGTLGVTPTEHGGVYLYLLPRSHRL